MTAPLALRAAMDLFKAGQPLASALVYAELAEDRVGTDDAELWCGLGSALMASRGRLVRAPFEEWASKVFRRGAPLFRGTPYAPVVAEWLEELPSAASALPLADAEIPSMIAFLLVNEAVLPDAIAALPGDDAMGVVMALGDRADPLYVPALRAAVEGKFGGGAARSALKRIGAFLDRPEMQASLLAASQGAIREELGPYLSFITDRLPVGWDGPRAVACPPYRGIGPMEIELTAAGSDAQACAALLCKHLGAAPRDAASWVAHAPCVVKRGAMRVDGLTLRSEVEALGGTVKLSGGDSSGPPPSPAGSAASEKPWWKFW
jgi:hypothetical protein